MRRLINLRPSRGGALALAVLPFVLLVTAYLVGSELRLAANPNDKLLPRPAAMAEAMQAYAFEPDKRSGDYLFWNDTLASLGRLAAGLAISALLALSLGLAIGLVPLVRASLDPFMGMLAMIPPLAILPILFILLGLGEVSKIALVTIGTAPFMIRDMALRAAEIPEELIVKAQTLGASTWTILLRVAGPMLLPRLLQSLRLAMGAAWLFVIAAEAIAATEGLGYRIFLVRRFLAMDVIIPYVIWITALAFALDWLLAAAGRRLFPWADTR